MRAETPCTCIIQHPCIPLIFYLMTFNIRFYQSFQTNLKHIGWELYFRGQRMVPCECSIEKHGTDAGQSFYVNIYNVIHQNIFVHCRERCGSQQSFFSTGEGRLVCVCVVFLRRWSAARTSPGLPLKSMSPDQNAFFLFRSCENLYVAWMCPTRFYLFTAT